MLLFSSTNSSFSAESVEKSPQIRVAIYKALSKILSVHAIGNIIIEAAPRDPTSLKPSFSLISKSSHSFRQTLVAPEVEEDELFRVSTNISSNYAPLFNENVLNRQRDEFSDIVSKDLAKTESFKFSYQVSLSSVHVEPSAAYDDNHNAEPTFINALLYRFEDAFLYLLSKYGFIIFLFVLCFVLYSGTCSGKVDEDQTKNKEDENQTDSKHTYVEIPNNPSAADLYSIYPDHDIVQFEYSGEIDCQYEDNQDIPPYQRSISSDSATDIDLYSVYPDDDHDRYELDPDDSITSALTFRRSHRSNSCDSTENLYDTFEANDSFQCSSPMRRQNYSSTSEDSSEEEDKFDFWPFF